MDTESEKQFREIILLQSKNAVLKYKIMDNLKAELKEIKAELKSSNEARNYYEKLHKQALSDLFKDNVLFPCEN